jgi:hypothetical protein
VGDETGASVPRRSPGCCPGHRCRELVCGLKP